MICEHDDISEDVYFVLKGTFLATRKIRSDQKLITNLTFNLPIRGVNRLNPFPPAITSSFETLVGVYRAGSDLELDTVTNCKPISATYTAASATGELMWLSQKVKGLALSSWCLCGDSLQPTFCHYLLNMTFSDVCLILIWSLTPTLCSYANLRIFGTL